MRYAAVLLLLAAAALAAPADSLARAGRDLDKAAKALKAAPEKAGKQRVAKLQLVKARLNSARRIVNSTLPRADKSLHPALIDVRNRAELQLVAILNEETGYYLQLKKKSLARKRNREALKILPKDADALRYQTQLSSAKKKSGGSARHIGTGELETRRSSLPGMEHRKRHDSQVPGRRPTVGSGLGRAR